MISETLGGHDKFKPFMNYADFSTGFPDTFYLNDLFPPGSQWKFHTLQNE